MLSTDCAAALESPGIDESSRVALQIDADWGTLWDYQEDQ